MSLRLCINCRIYCKPFCVVDTGAVVLGVTGDVPGVIVVPVDVEIVPVAVVSVGSVVVGGTVVTVDSVDGGIVVTVQRINAASQYVAIG